jgi:hypothetical protein
LSADPILSVVVCLSLSVGPYLIIGGFDLIKCGVDLTDGGTYLIACDLNLIGQGTDLNDVATDLIIGATDLIDQRSIFFKKDLKGMV